MIPEKRPSFTVPRENMNLPVILSFVPGFSVMSLTTTSNAVSNRFLRCQNNHGPAIGSISETLEYEADS